MSRTRECIILHIAFERNRREGGPKAVLCVFDIHTFLSKFGTFISLEIAGGGGRCFSLNPPGGRGVRRRL